MDKPLYHITPHKNVESILLNGLERRNPLGICVATTNHELIVEYITEIMLNNGGDIRFAVFQIIPYQHNLTYKDIADDNVEEITNPLHKYIKKDKLLLKPNDYIQSYIARPYGIPDKKKFESQIINIIKALSH